MTAADDAVVKPWIVWADYHSEGWAPHGFDTPEEAAAFVLAGECSTRVIVTRRAELRVAMPSGVVTPRGICNVVRTPRIGERGQLVCRLAAGHDWFHQTNAGTLFQSAFEDAPNA